LARYARLLKIEESFRINKHTLSMRPIYHFKPERIKAHIALCFMAFSVLRHMEYHIKLTQKLSLEVMLDELTHVQASFYRHLPTGKIYRIPKILTKCFKDIQDIPGTKK
jgi:transposase